RGEDVSLRQTHAERAQVHHLLEIFDAFGDHIHAHVARKIDQGFDNGCRVAIGADGIHEYLVDLDDVDAKLEHVRKPAVAGTDIVDCNAHAETLQGGDCLSCF